MKSIFVSSLIGLTLLNSSVTFAAQNGVTQIQNSSEQVTELTRISANNSLINNSNDLGIALQSQNLEVLQKFGEETAIKQAEEAQKAQQEAQRIAQEQQAQKVRQQAAQAIQLQVKQTPKPVSVMPVGDIQNYAKDRVCAVFGCEAWDAYYFIILKESTWNPNAINPTSGAGGLCQALPFTKMATAGADYRTNANTQTEWCLSYIKGRYKTPQQAKEFWVRNNWF
jgi:hypothetical protein